MRKISRMKQTLERRKTSDNAPPTSAEAHVPKKADGPFQLGILKQTHHKPLFTTSLLMLRTYTALGQRLTRMSTTCHKLDLIAKSPTPLVCRDKMPTLFCQDKG